MKSKLFFLPPRFRRPAGWGVGFLAVILLLGFLARMGRDASADANMFFEVRRGNVPITVMEGGSVEALEVQEIRSEVEGYQGTKILSIIDEGYQVTEQDVADQTLLVELDSSEIRQKLVTQELQFQSTVASLTEAQNALDIQVNQNLSDVKAAELAMKFARMDVEKFLGAELTEEIFQRLVLREPERIDVTILPPNLGIGEIFLDETKETPTSPPGFPPSRKKRTTPFADPPPLQLPPIPEIPAPKPETAEKESSEELLRPTTVVIDYSEYADEELLGDGEAQQKIRQAEDEWLVAKTDLGLAEADLVGTQRLFEKGFVTKKELENDAVRVEKAKVQVKATDTARKLFQTYEFPKTAEELVSKYEEALLNLDKTQKEAISKLAQAEAKFKSAQGRYRIEQSDLKELQEQLAKTKIYARKPGLVTYGGNSERHYYGEEQIREGATVRQRQVIITIPDMNAMGVRVKIHESYIKKVKKDMRARIRVESFPDRPIQGKVTKVAILPDSANRWMNPNLKVYKTTIKIEGVHQWLKPGMTAKVEILVDELQDVVFVPIQAVFAEEEEQVCYVHKGSLRRRVVRTGEYNDEYIQILDGLEIGEKVALKAPTIQKGQTEDAPPPPSAEDEGKSGTSS